MKIQFFHCLFLIGWNSTVCFLWMYFGLFDCFQKMQNVSFLFSRWNISTFHFKVAKKSPNNRDGVEQVETYTCIICLWSFSSFTQEAIKNKINSTNFPSLFLSIYFSSHNLKLSFLSSLKFYSCICKKIQCLIQTFLNINTTVFHICSCTWCLSPQW